MRVIRILLLPCLLSGCVAVWGGAYHIESEDSAGGAIRYDHVVISERAVHAHANEICAKYQKVAVTERNLRGVVLSGGSIDEMSFSCMPSGLQTNSQVDNVANAPALISFGNDNGEVQLIKEGGTFAVPVLINNLLTLNFTVDSGASDVSIPADVVMTLIRLRSISSSDFLGKQTYRLADGSTVPSTRFRIRTLKAGDFELKNVIGSIARVEGSLLLGLSFLSRFSSWSIDNQHHTLILNTRTR